MAVVGPGSIGRAVAVELARGGVHRVVVCGRRSVERVPVAWPDGMHEADFAMCTDPGAAPVAHWVLVATKAYQTEGAAAWLPRLCARGAPVAVLQNGVEHVERFAAHVPRARIVPLVVNGPVQRAADGSLRVPLGLELVAPADTLGEAFSALLATTSITVRLTDDWRDEAWKKLALNAARVVGALLGEPARAFRDGAVARRARELALEAIAVARADGARIDDAWADEIVEHFRRLPPESVDSLQADLAAGRPTEIEARNGAVVRYGARHGVPTPCNALAVARVLELCARHGPGADAVPVAGPPA